MGIALLLAGLASACARSEGGEEPRAVLAELGRELEWEPARGPRLSVSADHSRCRPAAILVGAFRRGCAAGSRSERLTELALRAAQQLRERGDADAMHAAALVDLADGSGLGKSLQRAISSLHTAARLADRPAPVLADLAAAYLVRAERASAPRDLFAALEAAESALEHEPGNRAAMFNSALALHRIGLVEEAARGWRQYLQADSGTEWAAAARGHLGEALAVVPPPSPPAPSAPLAAYTAYAAANPQGARMLGWCPLLGDWGKAIGAGDTARAEQQLARAEAMGQALERRPGGDATLADAARAIRALRGGRAARTLARGHAEFAAGCALEERAEFRNAAPHFAAAVAAADDSPTLRAWARLMFGSVAFHSGDARTGEAVFRESTAAADPVRHPALAARARLMLAAVLVRGDRYEAGLVQVRAASELFVRAGERENEGVTLDGMSITHFFLRDLDQGYALEHRALERLAPYRNSYRLHNLLSFAAGIVAADGFPRAAIRMQDEGLRVAERTGKPLYPVEARLTRAQLLASAGAFQRARADLEATHGAVETLADPVMRGWMSAQRRIAEATLSLRSDPARAGDGLDSAATFLLGMHAPLVALPAVVRGAQARLSAGDLPRATARLEVALAILEQRRDSIRMESRRAAVFEDARAVVDRVVMLRLAAGQPVEALKYLDRGRASLAPVAWRGAAPVTGQLEGPPGEVVLEYGLVGDTLLVWAVSGRRVELFRRVMDAARLVRTIQGVTLGLEGAAPAEELRTGLAQLHEWLIRPVAGRLGESGAPVVVIVDGDLAAVPFAALYDTRRRRYLVEDHPMRFAVSLPEARRPAPRAPLAEQAVFVSDPAFDPVGHPGLARLGEAAGEVREIAAGYPRGRVLNGPAADEVAVRDALDGAGMVHYAGHAVFDNERPERSYLLLAPTPGVAASGILEAGEIAQLDLHHLPLVVLAACRTVRTGRGRAAGFSGLAGAFLAAGAGGAVGSLWEVDDRLTRRMMTEFHRAYRASGNGPEALREAQIRLLRSADEAHRSPSAWAGFRYAGS